MARRNQIEGMDQLLRMMRRLGQVPQRSVTKGARAGAKIAQKAAKANAPYDKGHLKRGLKLAKEKRRKLGKAVFQITLDPKKGDIFIKPVRNPTSKNRSSDPTRAYYPASQEYGFFNHWAGKHIQGLHYLKKAIDNNKAAIEKETLEVLGNDIDKALRGG